MREFWRAIVDRQGKKEQRKTNRRTGGGGLIAEDWGPGPGPGPGPAFVLPERNRHGFCGGRRVLGYRSFIQSRR